MCEIFESYVGKCHEPLFTNLLSEKVRDFNGVIGNHKDKTEKHLWEFGKRLNFNESISSIVFRMVLIASGLFFVWRRGRFSENSGGDSRKMFLKQERNIVYIYRIWYFKKTTHCSKRFVLSLCQEITTKSHLIAVAKLYNAPVI